MQDYSNFSALAVELLQSCTKPLILSLLTHWDLVIHIYMCYRMSTPSHYLEQCWHSECKIWVQGTNLKQIWNGWKHSNWQEKKPSVLKVEYPVKETRSISWLMMSLLFASPVNSSNMSWFSRRNDSKYLHLLGNNWKCKYTITFLENKIAQLGLKMCASCLKNVDPNVLVIYDVTGSY